MDTKRYKRRLLADLHRWIAKGWVPEASRALIDADIPEEAQCLAFTAEVRPSPSACSRS
jgi:hypothetical protein